MIYYGCPKCGAAMASPDSEAGQTDTCPECGNVAAVPSAQTPSPAEPVVEDPTPLARPAQVPVRRADDALDELAAAAAPGPTVVAVAPQTHVHVHERTRKSANGLGIAGLVMGIIACLSAWIPVIGCISVPFALLGLFFGIVGAIASLVGRKTGAGMPLAAIIVAGTAALMQVFWIGAFGLVGMAEEEARGRDASTRQTMINVCAAIQAYHDAKGVYPEDLLRDLQACPHSKVRLDELGKVIKDGAFVDGFKRPIRYYPSGGAGGGPYLESAGRDGDLGSKDDNIRSDNM